MTMHSQKQEAVLAVLIVSVIATKDVPVMLACNLN